jgi:hypothetical protein
LRIGKTGRVFNIEQIGPLRRDNMQTCMRRAPMQDYVHNANIDLYRRLIAESERNPKRDGDRHKMLLTLLDEETAKDKKSHSVKSPAPPIDRPDLA